MIKDKNGRDLIEAEDIKKTWKEYTEELWNLDIPDNPDNVVANLEPDILENEVKWATRKPWEASEGGDSSSGGPPRRPLQVVMVASPEPWEVQLLFP